MDPSAAQPPGTGDGSWGVPGGDAAASAPLRFAVGLPDPIVVGQAHQLLIAAVEHNRRPAARRLRVIRTMHEVARSQDGGQLVDVLERVAELVDQVLAAAVDLVERNSTPSEEV